MNKNLPLLLYPKTKSNFLFIVPNKKKGNKKYNFDSDLCVDGVVRKSEMFINCDICVFAISVKATLVVHSYLPHEKNSGLSMCTNILFLFFIFLKTMAIEAFGKRVNERSNTINKMYITKVHELKLSKDITHPITIMSLCENENEKKENKTNQALLLLH